MDLTEFVRQLPPETFTALHIAVENRLTTERHDLSPSDEEIQLFRTHGQQYSAVTGYRARTGLGLLQAKRALDHAMTTEERKTISVPHDKIWNPNTKEKPSVL